MRVLPSCSFNASDRAVRGDVRRVNAVRIGRGDVATFFEDLEVQALVPAECGERDALPGSAHVQVQRVLLPRPLNADPRVPESEEVRAHARDEVVAGLHLPRLRLLEARLHAQMLLLGPSRRDPLQQPLVALVPAGHLQRHHAVTSERDHAELGRLPEQGRARPQAEQAEPRPEVRVVRQRTQEFGQGHPRAYSRSHLLEGRSEKEQLYRRSTINETDPVPWRHRELLVLWIQSHNIERQILKKPFTAQIYD